MKRKSQSNTVFITDYTLKDSKKTPNCMQSCVPRFVMKLNVRVAVKNAVDATSHWSQAHLLLYCIVVVSHMNFFLLYTNKLLIYYCVFSLVLYVSRISLVKSYKNRTKIK